MSTAKAIFKTECGALVEVISGDICCLSSKGKDLSKVEAKSADFKTEKHVPVVEKVAGGWKGRVRRGQTDKLSQCTATQQHGQ